MRTRLLLINLVALLLLSSSSDHKPKQETPASSPADRMTVYECTCTYDNTYRLYYVHLLSGGQVVKNSRSYHRQYFGAIDKSTADSLLVGKKWYPAVKQYTYTRIPTKFIL